MTAPTDPLTLPAVVVYQPWAALIALGAKSIETRPCPPNGNMRPPGVRGLPGVPINQGDRVLIVAGRKAPKEGTTVGDYLVERWRDDPAAPCLVRADDPAGRRHPWPVDLPLGVAVCTVTVAEALPMVDDLSTIYPYGPGPAVCIDLTLPDRPSLFSWLHAGVHEDLSPQLPLGEFLPGRWGWVLTDPEPCPPTPVTGRQGVFYPTPTRQERQQ